MNTAAMNITVLTICGKKPHELWGSDLEQQMRLTTATCLDYMIPATFDRSTSPLHPEGLFLSFLMIFVLTHYV